MQGLCSIPVELQTFLEAWASCDASGICCDMRAMLQHLRLVLHHLPEIGGVAQICKREFVACEVVGACLGAQMGFVDVQHLAKLLGAGADELVVPGPVHGSGDVDFLHHGSQGRVEVVRLGFHPLIDGRSLLQRLAQERGASAVVLLSYVSCYGSRL